MSKKFLMEGRGESGWGENGGIGSCPGKSSASIHLCLGYFYHVSSS